jgi:hypothetical protein
LDAWKFTGRRPCFVATFPGIDFTPELGIRARRFVDVMCVNGTLDMKAYAQFLPVSLRKKRKALQFSPFFYRHIPLKPVRRPRQVVFFSQSIMPASRESRLEVAATLLEAAKCNPDVKFLFKLRHLEEENKVHTHQEKYPYRQLIGELTGGALPENFSFTTTYMGDLLKSTDLTITCASTASIEALGSGVPSLFLTDYTAAKEEAHYNSLQAFLEGSGIQATKDDIIALKVRHPNREWLEGVISTEDHVWELLTVLARFDATYPAPGASGGRVCPGFVATLAGNLV